MNLRFQLPSLVLFLLLAAPFAGCKSGPLDIDATCALSCASDFSCDIPPLGCNADPNAVTAGCLTACKAAFAALSPVERSAFDPCFGCRTQTLGGQCWEALPAGACSDECNAASTAPSSTFSNAYGSALAASGVTCANGSPRFGPSACASTATSTTCDEACCTAIGPCTASNAAVAYTCAGSMCTCTAGKKKGTAFTGSCSQNAWDVCNL